MLTSDDIRKAAQKFYDNQEFQCGWEIGAGWANKQNAQEIAELKFRVEGDAILLQAANQTIEKERAKISELEKYRDNHLRTIAALQDEKAEMLEALKTVVDGYETDGMEGMRERDNIFYKYCKAAIEAATIPA